MKRSQAMKLAVLAGLLLLVLAGCGDDSYDYGYYYYSPYPPYPPNNTAQIFSDASLDGYLAKDATGTITVTQGMSSGVQSVLAGVGPTGTEWRAFLDFPLTEAGGLPPAATVTTAVLELYVESVQAAAAFPVRVDLVAATRQLGAADFDSAALATVATMVEPTAAGKYWDIDVTPLLAKAQALHATNAQLRFASGGTPLGVVEINDSTTANWQKYAPLLQVEYQ